MNAKDTIAATLDMSLQALEQYLEVTTDAQMLIPPSPTMHHLAWSLGHVIVFEHETTKKLNAKTPDLPNGFAELHDEPTINIASDDEFLSKTEYLAILREQRAATNDALQQMSDADLDCPSPVTFGEMCPTIAHAFLLIACHYMTHTGQFATINEKTSCRAKLRAGVWPVGEGGNILKTDGYGFAPNVDSIAERETVRVGE